MHVWQGPTCSSALGDVRIQVMPTEKWQQLGGPDVAGEAGDWVRVGSDFMALAHELAHLCERRLDGVEDRAHRTWTTRGIRKAEAEYEDWLRGQR